MYYVKSHETSSIGSLVKNLPSMQEMSEGGVQSLGQEDPLE